MVRKQSAYLPYADWKLAVDHALEREYAITIEDAGLNKQDLVLHWREQDSPVEYVDWLARKYDLTPISRGFYGIDYPLKTTSR